MKLKSSLLIVCLLFSITSQAQILITLLLGDKLNSEKIEFGIDGGINRSFFNDIKGSEGMNSFNLGFYFHIRMMENSYLSTGLRVKSNVGATGMPTYAIGNANFDTLYKDGTLTTKIGYFYLPVMFQQRIYKIVMLEGGFQAGLRTNATDRFALSAFNGDMNYEVSVKNNYAHLDAGMLAGIGFKLNEKPKSMSIGISYYYGLVNISKIPDQKIRNSSVYLYMKIPIGVSSAKS
jgi:hypothetical protein